MDKVLVQAAITTINKAHIGSLKKEGVWTTLNDCKYNPHK